MDNNPEAYQAYLQEFAESRQSQKTKRPVTPIIAPIIPPSSPSPIPTPPSYPPAFEFPFKHFRGTGESFTHPRRDDPTQYPIFRLPTTLEKTRLAEREWTSASEQTPVAYKSTEEEKVANAATTLEPEEIKVATSSKTDTTKDHVVVTPAYKVVELPAKCDAAPTITPPAHTSAPNSLPVAISVSSQMAPPPPPSSEDLARWTMDNLANQTPALQTAMRNFLHAASIGAEHMSSANAI